MHFRDQNTSFSASCAERGPPIWYSGFRPPGLAAGAEEGRGHVVDRGAEGGVIEDVEEVGPRLKREALVDFELPAQRQIDLGRAESVQCVPSEVALDRTRGTLNVTLLIRFPPPTLGSEIHIGRLATRFGRWTLCGPADGKIWFLLGDGVSRKSSLAVFACG
jgi:hypothetical protein